MACFVDLKNIFEAHNIDKELFFDFCDQNLGNLLEPISSIKLFQNGELYKTLISMLLNVGWLAHLDGLDVMIENGRKPWLKAHRIDELRLGSKFQDCQSFVLAVSNVIFENVFLIVERQEVQRLSIVKDLRKSTLKVCNVLVGKTFHLLCEVS